MRQGVMEVPNMQGFDEEVSDAVRRLPALRHLSV
jgi:hypothetical protein